MRECDNDLDAMQIVMVIMLSTLWIKTKSVGVVRYV